MLADFPVSAERSYIISAQMAETYFELGGERILLPNFDGINDPAAAEAMRLWIENAPDEGVKFLKTRGQNTLKDIDSELTKRIEAFQEEMRVKIAAMEGAEQAEIEKLHHDLLVLDHKLSVAEATRAQVTKAQARFKAFKAYESDWLLSHRVK